MNLENSKGGERGWSLKKDHTLITDYEVLPHPLKLANPSQLKLV